MNRYFWQETTPHDREDVCRLAESLEIPSAGAKYLLGRSLGDTESAARFLLCKDSRFHDPNSFVRMREAVATVEKAVAEEKRIMIHGDYDVDGISGTAILYLYLRDLVPEVFRFLPDRRKDGYGISARAVEWAIENQVGLVIAVDCGTSDGDLILELQSRGIDVVICDHHEFPPEGELPGIILNPIRDDEQYPFKQLCAAGVGFKLVQALNEHGISGNTLPDELLDLVALATVGDLVPLVDENRFLVRKGLELMNKSPRTGLRALRKRSSSAAEDITARFISFRLAPRLNAPGRLSSPKPALELLCTSSDEKAAVLAAELERQNSKRRDLTKSVQQEVTRRIEEMGDLSGLGGFIFASEGWDEGVLGIAASQVVDTYGKPAVLMSISGDVAKGSGRSVPGIHLKEQLDGCRDFLERYGGHSQAAGLTIKTSNIKKFTEALSSSLKMSARSLPAKPVLCIDAGLSLLDCSMELCDFLKICEPFGYGNREPVWKLSRLLVTGETAVVGKGHLKLYFQDEAGRDGEAIFFNGALSITPESIRGKLIDVALNVRKGYFLERYYPEIRVVDLRFAAQA